MLVLLLVRLAVLCGAHGEEARSSLFCALGLHLHLAALPAVFEP
jgi:hypothetical protein